MIIIFTDKEKHVSLKSLRSGCIVVYTYINKVYKIKQK